jgi:glutathione S-transferase
MALTLYYHPLSSYCHKVLIALYEAGTPFNAHLINLGDDADRAKLSSHWAHCKFPVLHDSKGDRSLPESSIIIEYLDQYAGTKPMVPIERERALRVRLWDRIFDNYMQTPLQQIVLDRMYQTNADMSGPRAQIATSYRLIEEQLATQDWIADAEFSLADCAAAPALFYTHTLVPVPEALEKLRGYFERLLQRPSVQRVLVEAKPYFNLYPFEADIPQRFKE